MLKPDVMFVGIRLSLCIYQGYQTYLLLIEITSHWGVQPQVEFGSLMKGDWPVIGDSWLNGDWPVIGDSWLKGDWPVVGDS